MRKFLAIILAPAILFCAQIEQDEADILWETVEIMWEKDYAKQCIQDAKEFYKPTDEKIQSYCANMKEKWIKKNYDNCLALWIKERLDEEK